MGGFGVKRESARLFWSSSVPLAEFFNRTALAASQVLEGFDPEDFEERLRSTSVGVAFSSTAADKAEGAALLDLVIRLMARLYPSLDIFCTDRSQVVTRPLAALARSINPGIEITNTGTGKAGVLVGDSRPPFETTVFAGATGWDSHVSLSNPAPIGRTSNPMGAGAAACIATANIFRRVFLNGWETTMDRDLVLSTYTFTPESTPKSVPNENWNIQDEVVLAGVGAIGMGAVWALARAPMTGVLHLVDPETVELTNLQRYVLANRKDVGRAKVRVAARLLRGTLRPRVHQIDWRTFVSKNGYRWSRVLAAFDSADARRELQSSLPRWIANAWTQVGDLGVSVHPCFGEDGACLACLYLPEGTVPNEDEVVAQALGIPARVADVRSLLHLGIPVPAEVLAQIATSLGLKPSDVLAFEGRPIRDLYLRGICGGGLIPLGRAGRPHPNVHVPLAHQSALAGVLLAAKLARVAAADETKMTTVARIDVQRQVPKAIEQNARRRNDGRCMCEDADFADTYRTKYSITPHSSL